MVTKVDKDQVLLDGEVFERHLVLEQMGRVLESRHFRNSKRYPTLLRFVVEQAVAGRTDGLKERTLGMEVFARTGDYDTNADPIVRVTAGEVRKRLAQYYHEAGHESEIRIELPVGAYVPHFQRPEQPGPGNRVPGPGMQNPPQELAVHDPAMQAPPMQQRPVPERPEPQAFAVTELPSAWATGKVSGRSRRPRPWRLVTLVLLCLLAAAVTGMAIRQRRAEHFWQPALVSANPLLIVIGVHTLDSKGQEQGLLPHAGDSTAQPPEDMLGAMVRSEMVPVSDLVSYGRVTDLLTRHDRRYTTSGSSAATMEDIRRGPLVLIGGLDNVWTMRLVSKLRYRFEERTQSKNGIVDSLHPETVWRFNNLQDAAATTRDYAIVASYFDTTIDQPVIVIAGIGKAGTEVASEFVTSDTALKEWLKETGQAQGKRNVELVLSTDVLDGKAGPPRVVAGSAW